MTTFPQLLYLPLLGGRLSPLDLSKKEAGGIPIPQPKDLDLGLPAGGGLEIILEQDSECPALQIIRSRPIYVFGKACLVMTNGGCPIAHPAF
jgi:hypothetical protein